MTRLIGILATLLLAQQGSADTFYLRSGGQLQGELLNPQQEPRVTYAIRLKSGGDLTLESQQVKRHRIPTQHELAYAELLQRMPGDTVEWHWKMAERCRDWSLHVQWKFHLEQVVRLEPDHAEARADLKQRKDAEGNWRTTEEMQRAAGLVRVSGRWKTPQQAKIEAAEEAWESRQIEWKKKLARYRKWLRDPRRRANAARAISAIKDSAAAAPLSKLFWEEVPARELIAEVLGRLPSGIATTTLARAAMETDTEMRLFCVKQLKENERFGVVSSFLPELRSSDNKRVQRAAYAIGELGNESSIFSLIKALNTQHKYKLNSGDNGNMNASFDPTGRTGGGLSMGKKKDQIITRTVKNKAVRDALSKLTNLDFSYREHEWLIWYLKRTTPPKLDLRRDA